MKTLLIGLAVVAFAGPALSQDAVRPGEEPVDAYAMANANAGAAPFRDDALFQTFHGTEGVGRIVDATLDLSVADPSIAGIFVATDMVRLRRTLKEQICYILGGGCDYTGRTMADAHKDTGLQPSDFGALVEHLQVAMDAEGVPFAAQNRLLAKLAAMRPDVVTR